MAVAVRRAIAMTLGFRQAIRGACRDDDRTMIARPESIAAAIAAHARIRGDAVAVDDGDEAIRFCDLHGRAAHLAERLRALPDPDAPVGILLPMSARYIVAIVAAILARRVYVPLDVRAPDARTARIMRHSGMGAIIVDAASPLAVDAGIVRIAMPGPDAMAGAPMPPVGGGEPVLNAIFYTSGSTGEPKGVCQDERGLIADICAYIDYVGITPDDRLSLFASPSISVSNRDIYPALIAGARLCIVDFPRMGARAAIAQLGRHRLTVFRAIPGMFRLVFGADNPSAEALAASVRLVRINGDRVLPSDVALFRRRFARGTQLGLDIGSTETKVYAAWLADHDSEFPDMLVPVGRAPPGQYIDLIDASGAPVPPGEAGEVVVTSGTMSVSYWRDPEMTRTRFVPSTRYPGLTEFRTGDIGRIDRNGLLTYLGRRDRQCKVQGNTVHPGEVEGVIGACDGVDAVAVIARGGAGGGAGDVRLIAYVAGSAPVADIRAWCRARLTPSMCPAEIVMCDALPELAPGKPDFAELARIDAARAAAADAADGGAGDAAGHAAELADAAGVAVAQVWTDMFDRASLARDRSFEEAGGDSLKAMAMLLALESRLGRALPADLVDLATRPSDLVRRLAAGDEAGGGGEDRPTILLFCGMYGADTDIIAFAHALRDAFDVRLIDYRDGGSELIGPVDIDRFFAAFDRRLAERAMPRRLWILGYSFGARVAAEAARRLVARGVAVEFLGVLDGPTDAVIDARNRRRDRSERRGFAARAADSGGVPAYLAIRGAARLTHRLVARGRYRETRRLVALLSRFGLREAARNATRIALARTRVPAFAGLPRGPVTVPTAVLVSSELNENAAVAADLGWSEMCGAMELVRIAGTHDDMIGDRSTPEVKAFLRAVAARSGAA